MLLFTVTVDCVDPVFNVCFLFVCLLACLFVLCIVFFVCNMQLAVGIRGMLNQYGKGLSNLKQALARASSSYHMYPKT